MSQLYSRQECCNVTFKMIRKVYIASGSPPPMKNCKCTPAMEVILSASCLSLEKQVPWNGVPQRGSGPVGSEITRSCVLMETRRRLTHGTTNLKQECWLLVHLWIFNVPKHVCISRGKRLRHYFWSHFCYNLFTSRVLRLSNVASPYQLLPNYFVHSPAHSFVYCNVLYKFLILEFCLKMFHFIRSATFSHLPNIYG